MQSQLYSVPREFMQLSVNADESRRRTESLLSSAAASEALPIKLLVGSHQHDHNTSRVQESVSGTHQLNGNCDIVDLSAQHGHVNGVSSRAATAGASLGNVVKRCNGVADARVISDCSESTSRVNGEVQKLDNGHEQQLISGRQRSDGSAKHNSPIAGDSNALVFVAAGHEVTRGQQKGCKDDKNSRPKQQMHYFFDSSAHTSPVKQQAETGSVETGSVSDQRRKQIRCFSNAAAATACNNQRTKVSERSVDNRSASGNVGDHSNGGYRRPRHGSSNAAVVPATGTCQTETDEYHTVSSSASLQSDCDAVSLSSDSSSPIRNGTTPRSSNAAGLNSTSVGRQEATSPNSNDMTEGDTVGQNQNHPGRAGATSPRQSNGIGRGQVLRMMFRGSPH